MPKYTVRPGLTLDLHGPQHRPRAALTLADYDALADLDVSGVVDTKTRKGKLIQCRLRSMPERPKRAHDPFLNPSQF